MHGAGSPDDVEAGGAERDLQFERMIEVKVSFDHDRDQAMQATRFWGALGLTQEQKAGVEDRSTVSIRAAGCFACIRGSRYSFSHFWARSPSSSSGRVGSSR